MGDLLDDVDDLIKTYRKQYSSNGNIVKNLECSKYSSPKNLNRSKKKCELFAEEEFIKKEHYQRLSCEMPGIPRSTFLMVFSPDGTKVASTHGNHHIYVSDVRNGKHIKTLEGHPRTPWCIAFHPSSNQIVASGCLGGQVRIWDLSGGSEVLTTNTVIASIAFHPNDRVLVIATLNEVLFWDWSKPQPFCQTNTGNKKDKVRFVAFDKLGHKLITGISNSVSRWERSRCQAPQRNERAASPYRCRIMPIFYRFPARRTATLSTTSGTPPTMTNSEPVTPSSVPERERNIAMCYRNLVREYGRLVQRYLQLYRPPVMIDRGTDPMDVSNKSTSGTQTPEPSSSGLQSANSEPVAGCSTQPEPGPPDLRKHKADSSDDEKERSKGKKLKTQQVKTCSKGVCGKGKSISTQTRAETNSDCSQEASEGRKVPFKKRTRWQDFDTTDMTVVTNSTKLISSSMESAGPSGTAGTSSSSASQTIEDATASTSHGTETRRNSEETLQCDCVTNSDPSSSSTANNCFADIPKFIRSILCTHHARMSSRSTEEAASSTSTPSENIWESLSRTGNSVSSGSQTDFNNVKKRKASMNWKKTDEGTSLPKSTKNSGTSMDTENLETRENSSRETASTSTSTNNSDLQEGLSTSQPSTSAGLYSAQPSTSRTELVVTETGKQVGKIISHMKSCTEEHIKTRVEQIMSSPMAQNPRGRSRQIEDLMKDICQTALDAVKMRMRVIERAPESEREELMRLFINMEQKPTKGKRPSMLPISTNRKVSRRTTPDTSSEATSSDDEAESSGERYGDARKEVLPKNRMNSSNTENSMLGASTSSNINLPSLQDYVYSTPPRRPTSPSPPIPEFVRQAYYERNVMSGDIEQADFGENNTVNFPPSTTTTNTNPILRSVFNLSDSSDTTLTDSVQRSFVNLSTNRQDNENSERVNLDFDGSSAQQPNEMTLTPTTNSEVTNTFSTTNIWENLIPSLDSVPDGSQTDFNNVKKKKMSTDLIEESRESGESSSLSKTARNSETLTDMENLGTKEKRETASTSTSTANSNLQAGSSISQPSTSAGLYSAQPSTSSAESAGEVGKLVEEIMSQMRNSTKTVEQIKTCVKQIMSTPVAQTAQGRNHQIEDIRIMKYICQTALEAVRTRMRVFEGAPESEREELMRNTNNPPISRTRQLSMPALANRKVNRRMTPDTSSEATTSDDDAELSGERYSGIRNEILPQDRMESSTGENSMLRTTSSNMRLPSLQDYVYSMPRTTRSDMRPLCPSTTVLCPTTPVLCPTTPMLFVRHTYLGNNVMSGDIEQVDLGENNSVNLTTTATTSSTNPIRSMYNLSDSSDTALTDSVQRRFVNLSTDRQDTETSARTNLQSDRSSQINEQLTSVPTTRSEMPNTLGNTNTRTTNSTIYTSSGISRRRSAGHGRNSAFQPTRMYYYPRTVLDLRRNRYLGYGRWRFNRPNRSSLAYVTNRHSTPPATSSNGFENDEVINFANLPNSEDPDATNEGSPLNFHPFDPPPNVQTINPENIGIGNMYSNIVQDLEVSLNDVRNIRATNRPGEMSDMLSNFSDRLENIMNHSEAILRNLRSSMDMLPPPGTSVDTASTREANIIFNDPSFYVRDQRAGGDNATSTDHTYPRILESALGADRVNSPTTPHLNDTMSPLMASLHMTISYIQRQASLLRRQVESIERIDRAMVEVAQLQLIRLLLVELTRYIRNMSGESRSTCMSSVRQMMAGTRISDSRPGESQSEESSQPSTSGVTRQPQTASSTTTSSDASSAPSTRPPRSAGRKTYPPSRLSRFQRFLRRTNLLNYVSRRYGARQSQNRLGGPPLSRFGNSGGNFMDGFMFSRINTLTLSRMLRRLEELIIEQVDAYVYNITPPTNLRAQVCQLDEQNLANRLLRSVTTTNRLVGNVFDTNIWRNYRLDTTSIARGGTDRFLARHTLTCIIDVICKYLDDNRNSTVPVHFRTSMRGVMTMAMLVSELLLLQIVESIPPPTGMNFDQERSSMISRVNQMCNTMLVSRFMCYSSQLVSSLHRCMMHTYLRMHQPQSMTANARSVSQSVFPRRIRNAMGSERMSHRVQMLGRIGRSLRSLDNRLNNELTRLPAELTRYRAERRRLSEENDSNESDSRSQPERRAPRLLSVPSWAPNREERVEIRCPSENPGEQTCMVQQLSPLRIFMSNRERSPVTRLRSSNLLRSLQTTPSSTASTNTPSTSGSSTNVDGSNRRTWPNVWNVPTVQVNDIPLSELIQQAENTALSSISPAGASRENPVAPPVTQGSEQPQPPEQESSSTFNSVMARIAAIRAANQTLGAFRPRFLHPLYAGVNPFDADLDDPQRESIYDSDVITTVTPNHRIQVWDISSGDVPSISNPTKNVVVAECKIHNDASVDIASDGSILVTLLPSGGYLNITNRLGVYSLRWENLGQCLYTTNFEHNAVSVSLSPLAGHLVVGLANRRMGCGFSGDRLLMAQIFKIDRSDEAGDRLEFVRALDQPRDVRANSTHKNVNCVRWLPTSGQGLIFGTNTGQLVLWT